MPNLPSGSAYSGAWPESGNILADYYRGMLALQAERRKNEQYSYEKDLDRANELARARLASQASLEHAKELNKGALERLTQAEKYKTSESFDALKKEAAGMHVPITSADTPETLAAKISDKKDEDLAAEYKLYQNAVKQSQGEIDKLSGRFSTLDPERQKEIATDILRDPSVTRYMNQDQQDRLRAFAGGKESVSLPNGTTIPAASPDQIQSELSANQPWTRSSQKERSTAIAASIAKSIGAHSGKYDSLMQLNAFRIKDLATANLERQKRMEQLLHDRPSLSSKIALPETTATGDEGAAAGSGDPLKDFADNKRAHTNDQLELAPSQADEESPDATPPDLSQADFSTAPVGRYTSGGGFEPYYSRAVPPGSLLGTNLGGAPSGGYGLSNLAPPPPAQPTNYLAASGFLPAPSMLGSPRQSFTQKLAAAKAHALANGVSEQQLNELWRRANSGDREAMNAISQAASNFDESGQPSLGDYAPLEDYPPVYK